MLDPWFSDQYPLKYLSKRLYWRLAERDVLRGASSVLFTCETEMRRAREWSRRWSFEKRVVRFGTADHTGDADTEKNAFFSMYPELRNSRFLLFLGRIHQKKGCDLLISAFGNLASVLSPDMALVIAGPDRGGLKQVLQAKAKALGIDRRVHWPGMISDDVKWGAYRAAEALVLPSHQENFGIVVAEAMACSTPVLLSDKVNIWREVVRSGGGLVESDTFEGTCNLIRRFWSLSSSERAKMRQAARTGFERQFDIRGTAEDILLAIDEVLSERKAGSHRVVASEYIGENRS